MNKERKVFQGRIIDVTVEQATLPNGRTTEIEVVRHPGGAAVVALDDAGRVCLLRQYRPARREWIWELPAGKLDPGEEPLTTAQRELREEAGATAREWRSLGRLLSSPGVFNEVIHLYVAEGLSHGDTNTEEHELIEVHWVPLDQALTRAVAGDIEDAKTVAGLFRAARERDRE